MEKVDVNLTSSTTATVTLTSLTNGGNIYLFGGNNALDLNVNATSFSASGFSGTTTGTGFSVGTFSPSIASGQNVDGRGTFNFTLNEGSGFGNAMNSVTLTLTNTGGTWSSASDVLTQNGSNNYVAAHVFVAANPSGGPDQSKGALKTGFAGGDTGINTVPAPSSVILLGAGAFGLLGFTTVRRLRWKPVAA